MLSSTHRLIGEAVLSNLENNFSIKLDRKAFIYGCIKPDFNLGLISIPHYKDKSFGFILKLISKISSSYLPVDKKSLKSFSTNLGVILHFISDYFCFAHNNKKYDPILVHISYEKILSQEFIKTNLSEIINNMKNIIDKSDRQNKSILIDFIENKHREYLSLPASMMKDIEYSTKVSGLIAAFVISSCTANNLAKAA